MIIRKFQIGKAGAELSGWLHPDYSSERESAFSSRPAVIICPGGGYAFHSVIEEDEAMGALYAAGFDVFSLHYSTGDLIAESEPEAELAQTVSLLRHMAPELGLNGKVAVMGFSAGGHLSASLGCHWTDFGDNCRPDCLVLCYPVISMGKLGHEGSTLALCHGDEERVRRFSLENADVSCCPPAFIWHSQEDELVDVRNSMLFPTAGWLRPGVPVSSTCSRQECTAWLPETRLAAFLPVPGSGFRWPECGCLLCSASVTTRSSDLLLWYLRFFFCADLPLFWLKMADHAKCWSSHLR